MVQDNTGQVFGKYRRQRIISLVPSVTETLFDLGLDNEIIGVTRYCIYPQRAQNKEIVGGTKSPKLDKIRELNPDIIIMNQEENRKEHYVWLSGIAPTYVCFPKTLNDGIQLIMDLASLFDIQEDEYLKYKHRFDNLISEVLNIHSINRSLFCPIWRDPWMTINKETYIHSFLETFGLINHFGNEINRYPTIDLDQLDVSIDVVILPDEPYKFEKKDLEEIKKKSVFSNSFVEIVDGSMISWYGTRTIKGLEYFLNLLHIWKF